MRAFVIGNGPSLTAGQLEKLKGEVTFATNHIALMYEKTDWRPTHFVMSESPQDVGKPNPDLWEADMLLHLEDPGVVVWCNLFFIKWLRRRGYDKNWENVNIIKGCAHYDIHFHDVRCPHLWHLPRFCTFGSVVNVAIQIAVTQGYSPIYLVGCDLGYQDGMPSHFDRNYEAGHILRPARYANLDTLAAHSVALRSSPVPIYNASEGGYLEVYERRNLDEVLRSRERPISQENPA